MSTEPTLRDMYRLSGDSHSPPTTLPGDASQPTAPASTSGRGLQITTAPQPKDDSESSSDEPYWSVYGSQYPTQHQQGAKPQQSSSSPQAPKSSRSSSTRKRDNSENQPSETQTPGARQRLSGGSQLPSASRSSDDRPRHSGAPQAPAVSWPYDEGRQYTGAPESKTSTQTSGQARRPSADKAQYVSIVQQPTGSVRRSDRYSSGSQTSASQPATSNTSRPYDDRHRYNVRTADDKQRFSNASTIAQPASARQSEDKPRFGSGFSATAPGRAADTVRPVVATNTSPRDQANGSTIPRRTTDSKSVTIAISSDDAKSIEQTEQGPDTPVGPEVFRALLGFPPGNKPLPLSNIRHVAESLDEGRTPTSLKTPLRTSTGKTTIAEPFKVKSRGPSFLPRFLRRKHDDAEYDISVYHSLTREERKTNRHYRLYDVLIYVCLIAQLIIAAVLIVLGAVNGDYHIPVAVLGAVTGLITGVLSLIRGQGLPQRLMRYSDALRQVRENIEFTGRELIANVRTVTYRECVRLRTEYETVRDDEVKNHPDTWISSSTSTSV